MLKVDQTLKNFRAWLTTAYPTGRGLVWVKRVSNSELSELRRGMFRDGYIKENYKGNFGVIF